MIMKCKNKKIKQKPSNNFVLTGEKNTNGGDGVWVSRNSSRVRFDTLYHIRVACNNPADWKRNACTNFGCGKKRVKTIKSLFSRCGLFAECRLWLTASGGWHMQRWVAGDQQTYGGTGQDPEESHLLHNVLDGQFRSRDKILQEKTTTRRSSWKRASQLSEMNKMGIFLPKLKRAKCDLWWGTVGPHCNYHLAAVCLVSRCGRAVTLQFTLEQPDCCWGHFGWRN